jgi:hypothetical protein
MNMPLSNQSADHTTPLPAPPPPPLLPLPLRYPPPNNITPLTPRFSLPRQHPPRLRPTTLKMRILLLRPRPHNNTISRRLALQPELLPRFVVVLAWHLQAEADVVHGLAAVGAGFGGSVGVEGGVDGERAVFAARKADVG